MDSLLPLLPYGLGALSLFCVVIVIRPQWFRNWSIVSRGASDSPYDDSRVRLGSMSTGAVRALYTVVAILLMIGAFWVHGRQTEDKLCDVARSLSDDHGTDVDAARDDAERAGYRLSAEKHDNYTVVTMSRDGRPVAEWSDAGFGGSFTCPL